MGIGAILAARLKTTRRDASAERVLFALGRHRAVAPCPHQKGYQRTSQHPWLAERPVMHGRRSGGSASESRAYRRRCAPYLSPGPVTHREQEHPVIRRYDAQRPGAGDDFRPSGSSSLVAGRGNRPPVAVKQLSGGHRVAGPGAQLLGVAGWVRHRRGAKPGCSVRACGNPAARVVLPDSYLPRHAGPARRQHRHRRRFRRRLGPGHRRRDHGAGQVRPAPRPLAGPGVERLVGRQPAVPHPGLCPHPPSAALCPDERRYHV